MGANTWRHVPSMEKMESSKIRFYLDKSGTQYRLSAVKPTKRHFMDQSVDLDDRNSTNNDYYPDPIIKNEIDRSNGLFFLSQPFESVVSLSGKLEGVLKAIINKRDMDIGLTLYELTPEGQYFQLSYFLGRASYAHDMTQRKLLIPGKEETIPFHRSRVFSKQLKKGSRLLLVLNIDKNPFAQINYGTGKEVSRESILDAGQALKIKWSTGSFIDLGISRTN